MRALLSVFDKTGLVEFATGLREAGVELVSSGGTARALQEAGIEVTPVEAVTGAPEMFDHRVVTLHPKIHGGILADRSKASHLEDLERFDIQPFDLVVVNLYPFGAQPGIEMIDIGGPAMVRAAAKNHAWIGVVTSPDQYDGILAELGEHGRLTEELRTALALEAFAHTAAYDAAIVAWLQRDETLPRHLVIPLTRTDEVLRYGENPHQQGARYRRVNETSWWDGVIQHGGVALSYLNLYDTEAAWVLAHDLGDRPAVAIIKHANPCGIAIGDAASGDPIANAHAKAHLCDEKSAFGGVIAANRMVTVEMAKQVAGIFTEVIVAPGFEIEALQILLKKSDLRILELPAGYAREEFETKQISGGLLVQQPDEFSSFNTTGWKLVAGKNADPDTMRDLEFAWRACRSVKSNAILLANHGASVGVGMGQVNRVDSCHLAVTRADSRARGSVAASDAFFPFADGLQVLIDAGVRAVITPGGSKRDAEVIAAAEAAGLTLYFANERHFFH